VTHISSGESARFKRFDLVCRQIRPMLKFDRSSLPGWLVWLCFPLTIGLATLIYSFHLPIIDPNLQQIPAYKVTFIAVLMALGVFQYNMSIAEAEGHRKVIDEEDFSPAWREYKQKTDNLRNKILSHPPHEELPNEWLNELKFRDEQLKSYVEWHRTTLPRVLFETSVRFILIFSVGLGLLISLWMDILKLLGMWILSMDIDPVALSQSFLFASLIFFAFLFCVYILALSYEIAIRNTAE
jgi:hypothetical protein